MDNLLRETLTEIEQITLVH